MTQDNNGNLIEADRKLTILINLLAYQIVEGKTLAEGAPILRRLGLKAPEIAAVFGSTANTVHVQLTLAKRKKAKPKGN